MVDTEPPFTEYFLSGMLRSRPNSWSRFGGIDKRKSLDREYESRAKRRQTPSSADLFEGEFVARNRVRVDAPVRPALSG